MCIFNYIKVALFGVMLTLPCNIQAVIINTINDSFIDEDTGLEWMDFGINSGTSFNDTVMELGFGGLMMVGDCLLQLRCIR